LQTTKQLNKQIPSFFLFLFVPRDTIFAFSVKGKEEEDNYGLFLYSCAGGTAQMFNRSSFPQSLHYALLFVIPFIEVFFPFFLRLLKLFFLIIILVYSTPARIYIGTQKAFGKDFLFMAQNFFYLNGTDFSSTSLMD
jgi:hypothetical protein